MNYMICGHSYVYWDVWYKCDPCFIHHSNQCKPFQIKTFHTINSIFGCLKTDRILLTTNPCRQMGEYKQKEQGEMAHEKEKTKRRQFHSGVKVIGDWNYKLRGVTTSRFQCSSIRTCWDFLRDEIKNILIEKCTIVSQKWLVVHHA